MSMNQQAQWSYHCAIAEARQHRIAAMGDRSIQGAFRKLLSREWLATAKRIRLGSCNKQ